MGIGWDIVAIGLACACIGLWAGWGIYRGKMKVLKLEIKALKRELSDERVRSEAYGKAADEWRGVAMRADAEVERLKHEKALFPGYWRDASDAPETDGSYLIRTPTGWAEGEYRKDRGWYQYRWGVQNPEIIKWCDVDCTRLGG